MGFRVTDSGGARKSGGLPGQKMARHCVSCTQIHGFGINCTKRGRDRAAPPLSAVPAVRLMAVRGGGPPREHYMADDVLEKPGDRSVPPNGPVADAQPVGMSASGASPPTGSSAGSPIPGIAVMKALMSFPSASGPMRNANPPHSEPPCWRCVPPRSLPPWGSSRCGAGFVITYLNRLPSPRFPNFPKFLPIPTISVAIPSRLLDQKAS